MFSPEEVDPEAVVLSERIKKSNVGTISYMPLFSDVSVPR